MKVKVTNGDFEGNEYNVLDFDDFHYVTNEVDIKPLLLEKHNCEVIVESKSDSRVFPSGAKRDSDKDKPYCHNLQGYTRLRFGYHTRMGANKYGDGNFLLGMPKDQAIQSNDRHWAKYLAGDRTEDHLSAMIFNLQLIMLNEEKEGIQSDYYFKQS